MKLLKIFRENFSIKVFVTFSLLIIIVASSFTCLFILRERKELTDNLRRKGELIAELLAYNSRLGVFAENKELLKNSAEGFFQYGEVVSLSIFTTEGKQLLEQRKQKSKTQGKEAETEQEKLRYIADRIRRSGSPFYLEGASDTVEFWAPVLASSRHFSKEFPFVDNNSFYAENRMIGFAGVVLDKSLLNKQLHAILLEGILMGIIFLAIGFISTYPVVKRITKPLNKLTENVKALGKGVAVEEVPVETVDELGRLAHAFNIMVTERREAEKALFTVKARLQYLLTVSPAVIYSADVVGDRLVVTFVSENIRQRLGYEPQDIVGNPSFWFDRVHPDDIAGAIAEGSRLFEQEYCTLEYRFRHQNGAYRWLHDEMSLVWDAKGNPLEVVGSWFDITERNKAERALQKSEKQYRDLVDNALVGVYKTNLEGDFLYVNEALWHIIEFESSVEMMADGVLSRYKDPGDRKVLIERLRKEHQVENFETVLLTKTGKSKHVILSASLEGDIISGMIMDITLRKRAEEDLRESEKKYRAIFENTGTATVIDEEDTTIYLANAEFEKLSGYSKEEMVGKKSWTEFVAKDDLDRLREYHRLRRIDPNVAPRSYEFRFVNREGNVKDILATVHAIPETKRSVASLLDITERKYTQEKLQSLSRRLIEVQEADRRFLAGELHDQIGQNLTALGINLNIVCGQTLNQVDKKIMERLEDSLKLVEEVIERVRNVMSGLRPPVLDDYGLVAALRWYAERFSERTGVATLLQEEEFSSRLPLAVETALFRIVQEVLTNVAKHAQARQVDIILEKVDGLVQLTVTDDGVGFDRAASRQYKQPPGWGLITIEERATAIGGNVYVKSTPGEGTQIIVELPC